MNHQLESSATLNQGRDFLLNYEQLLMAQAEPDPYGGAWNLGKLSAELHQISTNLRIAHCKTAARHVTSRKDLDSFPSGENHILKKQ